MTAAEEKYDSLVRENAARDSDSNNAARTGVASGTIALSAAIVSFVFPPALSL